MTSDCASEAGKGCEGKYCGLELSVSMFHYNIQGVSNKEDMLMLYLSDKKFNILCLTEHWLNSNDLNCLHLRDYKLVSSFCRNENIHGGVAIFALIGEDCFSLDVDKYCIPFHAEFAGAMYPRCRAVIIGIYRSSSNGNFAIFLEQLESLLDSVFHTCKYIVLMGDINCDLVECNANGVSLRDLLSSYGLTHTIVDFTRVTNTSASRLDNIITNYDLNYSETGVVEPGLSDHNAQFIKLKVAGVEGADCVMRTSIKAGGLMKLKRAMSLIDWEGFSLGSMSAESSVCLFLNVVQHFVQEYSITKKVEERHGQLPVQWFSRKLMRMRDALSAVKTVCAVTGGREDWEVYKHLKRDYRKEIEKAKLEACSNFILNAENKSKNCWRLINSHRSTASGSMLGGVTPIKPDDFNEFFVGAPGDIVRGLPDHQTNAQELISVIPNNNSSFFLRPVTEADVMSAMARLKNKSSQDHYNLSNRIMKSVCDVIVRPLTVIFNRCLTDGVFPESLKVSRIRPVYKKGNKNDVNNYRPIAITPVISKIFEIILSKRLLEFLNQNNLLNSSQFGFRSGCSTADALSTLLGDIVEGLDMRKHTSVVLCDLTKAFDCVSPDLLADKLTRYGVRGHSLKLFQSYLSDRKQYVEIDGVQSLLQVQKYGVPQGSVLGPLLFNLYINDLPLYLGEKKCVIFADDTTLYASGSDLHALKIETDSLLQQATYWFEMNQLKLNQSKTKTLIFTSDKLIKSQQPVTLLGINLDAHLTWGSQVDRVCSKIASNLYALRKLSGMVPQQVLRVAYFALVESHLTYGLTLWGRSADVGKVFVMQKRAIRAMARIGSREHCTEWFRRFRVLTLPSLYIYCSIVKICASLSIYSTHSDLHNYETRSRDNLLASRSRLTMSQKNKLDVRLFNKLPENLKQLDIKGLKAQLREILVDNCFYSVEQYLRTGLDHSPK